MGNKSKGEYTIGSSSTTQGLLILVLPATTCAVYGVMPSYLEGLILYITPGIEYSIGTGGYTVNGIQAIDQRTFDYPTPEQWPNIIRRFPKLFIAHFSISLLLGGYIFLYVGAILGIYFSVKPEHRNATPNVGHIKVRETARQGGKLGYLSLVVALVSLGVGIADVILVVGGWGAGGGIYFDESSSCKPTGTGWALGIIGGLASFFWLVAMLYLRLRVGRKEGTLMSKSERRSKK